MLFALLLACPTPGLDDTGGPWKGGQTGSEAISCDDESATPLEVTEAADDDAPVEGTWALTFTWDDDYREEALTLEVVRTGDFLAVTSEECGDRLEFEADLSFVLAEGAFDEQFTAVVQKSEQDGAVYEFWGDVTPQGDYEGDVTIYAAFPSAGPTGSVVDEELIGRF